MAPGNLPCISLSYTSWFTPNPFNPIVHSDSYDKFSRVYQILFLFDRFLEFGKKSIELKVFQIFISLRHDFAMALGF